MTIFDLLKRIFFPWKAELATMRTLIARSILQFTEGIEEQRTKFSLLSSRVDLLEKAVHAERKWAEGLFHEKHEMIMSLDREVRSQAEWSERLFHEKHEMIMSLDRQVRSQREWSERLFHEKHELILEDRRTMLWLLRNEILCYFKEHEFNEDQASILKWLENHSVRMYPYDFVEEYTGRSVNVISDETGNPHVVHLQKKMYFPRNYTEERVVDYYNFLIMEQDPRSPHCYFNSEFFATDGGCIADVGAAEGLIGLELIDNISYLYLFESDPEWVEALKLTFAPYSSKVKIFPKVVAGATSENTITLRDAFEGRSIDLIKIDVEGAELPVLQGLEGHSMASGSRLVVCTYHNQEDERTIGNYLDRNGYRCSPSNGYLFSDWGRYSPPYFRRGLLRAEKQ